MRITLLCLSIVALLTVCASARAQQSAKIPRVGYLGGGSSRSLILDSFRLGLRELGYVDGQNIVIEGRPYNGDPQLEKSAAELVQLDVNAIVAQGTESVRAAMKVTNTIPIVIIVPNAAHNFVASLERPGGNVTGVRGLTAELGGKWLELLKETIQSVKRVTVFWNRAAEDKLPIWKSVELAARSLKLELDWLEVGGEVGVGLPVG